MYAKHKMIKLNKMVKNDKKNYMNPTRGIHVLHSLHDSFGVRYRKSENVSRSNYSGQREKCHLQCFKF